MVFQDPAGKCPTRITEWVQSSSISDLMKLDHPAYVLELDQDTMPHMNKTQNILLTALFMAISACTTGGQPAAPMATTTSPQPTATEITTLPTPASPGDSITWRTLQVTMDQIEITDEFITEFGTSRVPSNERKFLWVHVQLKNVGQIEINTPLLENFSVLYAATELKPSYGHRRDYREYSTLQPVLFPNDSVDGWIRFDIPAAAELNDLRFVYLPISAQVGASFSSPNYPYSKDKPTYVWECSP